MGVLTNPFVYIRDMCVTYRTYLVNAHLQCRFLGMVNRPFPSSTNSHFKKGAKCETLAVQMGFICVRMKSRFHINGCALNLALKQIKGLRPVQNGLLQVFEERKSAEELQSTIFIMHGHSGDLGLASSLVGVRNRGSYLSQISVIYFFLGFGACPYYRNVRYSSRGCPQDES